MSGYGTTGDAGTVAVRVQIIDVEAFALDLVIPTYIAAKDLSQRVARDAGLGATWPGTSKRRQFWLRARGRMLTEQEKLQDLGVVSGELLHVLPQPPEGSGVIERNPEYPETHWSALGGWLNVGAAVLGLLVWTALWAIALTYTRFFLVALLPPLAIALSAVTAARNLWGGPGSSIKIPVTGLGIMLPFVALAFVPALVFADVDPALLGLAVVGGFISAVFGVVLGWLAWYGAVEPLPERAPAMVQMAAAGPQTAPCGICGGLVDLSAPEMMELCQFGCGKVFHAGCFAAKASVFQGEGCSVCGYNPAA